MELSVDKSKKRYRPNVAAIILSPKYPFESEIFIAKRNDVKNSWQFPQGGIDKGESPKEALFRELKEEIGTDKLEIVAEYPKWVSYDFPNIVAKKMYPYDGQVQRYFLVRLKPKAKIDIDTKHPEFEDYKFVKYDEIFKYIMHFKRPIYKEVLKYFKKEGYL